ncbi:vitellogenin C [Solea senegalensis]|uniref:Vitellogenin C n=1 Tax=Solea senegalensis TaxID=28829 RepID=A0AAV6SAC6_SOLSE|nr:vitellogenin C [Solea senegalensis]
MIVEVGDARILKFLEARFQAAELSASEALQTFLLSMNHLDPIPELVEMAKMFLNMPFTKSNTYLWHTVVLSYGSLVYKHCAYYTPCPVDAVQPLLDMALEALKNGNDTDMVLAMKALGNAGHPGSIKTIMRFLPGVAATAVNLPPRVLSAAVQSMRLIAARDPHSVQDISMTLFLQKNLPAEIRMLAFMVLFDTKPSMALVSTVTSHLQQEDDLHIVSFTYSYLKSMARSSTPDNHFLVTACNMAVKILAPKYGRLSYHYSKAVRMDCADDFLMGTVSEVFMLRSATNFFPTEIMMKGKFHFIGRILQLLELGIRAEGIQELFRSGIPSFRGDLSYNDLQAVLDVAVSPAAGKESPVWDVIESLKKGVSWHKTKMFLIFEVRYIQATTVGLPVEISKYYGSLNGISVNAKAAVSPPLTEHLGQLLTSDVTLESDGFVGYSKDFFLYYGINTELFQSGTEVKAKIPLNIPWRFSAKINIPKKKFELDIPACKQEFEVLSVSSNVYAVSRNIEEPTMDKMTPMMPKDIDSNHEIVHMDPSVVRPESDQSRERNLLTKSTLRSTSVRADIQRAHTKCFRLCGSFPRYLAAPSLQLLRYSFHLNSPDPKLCLQEATQQVHLSSDSASSARGSNHSRRDSTVESLDSTPEALFTVKALAMSSSEKPEGYDAAMYYTHEANVKNSQMIVSQVGEDTNWKMCMDTTVSGHARAQAHIAWGAECQSYEMSMTAATGHLPGAMPTLKAKVHWTRIPESLAEIGRRVESYIPGIGFLLGFNQEPERNAKQEVSASVVAASADSLDVKIRLPEYTVYRKAMPFPLPPATSDEVQRGTTNTTRDGLGHA